MSDIGTVERAVQLARGGSCRTVDDIRKTLIKERYDGVLQHLGSPSLKRQLVAMMKLAAETPTG